MYVLNFHFTINEGEWVEALAFEGAQRMTTVFDVFLMSVQF